MLDYSNMDEGSMPSVAPHLSVMLILCSVIPSNQQGGSKAKPDY